MATKIQDGHDNAWFAIVPERSTLNLQKAYLALNTSYDTTFSGFYTATMLSSRDIELQLCFDSSITGFTGLIPIWRLTV